MKESASIVHEYALMFSIDSMPKHIFWFKQKWKKKSSKKSWEELIFPLKIGEAHSTNWDESEKCVLT